MHHLAMSLLSILSHQLRSIGVALMTNLSRRSLKLGRLLQPQDRSVMAAWCVPAMRHVLHSVHACVDQGSRDR